MYTIVISLAINDLYSVCLTVRLCITSRYPVKYLGCYFSVPSAEVDLSLSLGKFHGSFINILNVIGHNRDQILALLAVHPTKTYCQPTGCKAWAGCATAFEIKSLSVAWNDTFRKIFNSCWREVPDHYSFIVAVSLLVILLTSVVCCFGNRC